MPADFSVSLSFDIPGAQFRFSIRDLLYYKTQEE